MNWCVDMRGRQVRTTDRVLLNAADKYGLITIVMSCNEIGTTFASPRDAFYRQLCIIY